MCLATAIVLVGNKNRAQVVSKKMGLCRYQTLAAFLASHCLRHRGRAERDARSSALVGMALLAPDLTLTLTLTLTLPAKGSPNPSPTPVPKASPNPNPTHNPKVLLGPDLTIALTLNLYPYLRVALTLTLPITLRRCSARGARP